MNSVEQRVQLVVEAGDSGTRLDAFLAKSIDNWSRSRLQRLINDEDVLVNDHTVKPSYRVRADDSIDIDLVEIPAAVFEPQDIPIDIVFEDEHLAVVNKAAGMVVHPGAGVPNGTLANAIAYHFRLEPSDSSDRVGIVHRLDKDTSGLMVVAKSESIQEALSNQFRDRTVFKSYVALVHGAVPTQTGKVEALIARNKHDRLRMKIAAHGRSAISIWNVRDRYEKFTLLDVEIKTGRTHQIRVHMAHINHPVVGDEIYNEGRDNTIANTAIRQALSGMRRFFLHAERLEFDHPITRERLAFKQGLPEELIGLLELL